MLEERVLKIFHSVKTPFYYYDMDLLRRTLAEYAKYLRLYGFQGHYAIKANSDERVLREVVKTGLGADCVSGNEVRYSIEKGFSPGNIVFAGVGKTDSEIREALELGIHCFNCESVQELQVIEEIAGSMGVLAPVAIRINPNVDAHTHRYITTGVGRSKFGIYENSLQEVFEILRNSSNLKFTGLHFHIGSQIQDLNVFRSLCQKVNYFQNLFRENGFCPMDLNMGGGLAVDYENPEKHPISPLGDYFRIFHESLQVDKGQTVRFEAGRALVAQCASLISRVLYVKESNGTRFLILDAGMNDLIRPALYGAQHKIENLEYDKGRDSSSISSEYDVVGPICESSDTWGKNISLPQTERGDLLAIRSAGAYGQVMSMGYNMREKAGSLYSDDFLMRP